MRKLITLLLVSILLCCNVFAHSGKTDSRGGHMDHSTGTYHYHHGYPAHQHTGGVCPYSFDDKTGENSGSNNNGNNSGGKPAEETSPPKPSQGEVSTLEKETRKTIFDDAYWPFWFSLCLLVCFAIYKVKKSIQAAKSAYSGKSISQLAGVPYPYSMGFDNCIYCDGQKVAPSSLLVVYVTKYGKSYHGPRCSCLKSTRHEITLVDANSKGYKRCRSCNPVGSVPTWVIKYKTINKTRKRYKIDMTP